MKLRIKFPEIEFEISRQFKFCIDRYPSPPYWDYMFIYFACFSFRIGKLI